MQVGALTIRVLPVASPRLEVRSAFGNLAHERVDTVLDTTAGAAAAQAVLEPGSAGGAP